MASAYQPLNVVSAYESVYTRFLAVPGLLLATALVIALLLSDTYGHTFPGHFYDFVVANRSSTAIIVQILSHLLGALYVFALTNLINFRTRLTLTRQPVSLFRLTWWNLLCNRQLDGNLPLRYGILLVVWWALSIGPSALWAGAITPVTTSAMQNSSIAISKYTPDPDHLAWNQTSLYFQEGALNTTIILDRGSFSFYPAYSVGGLILDTATDIGSNQTHAKHDRTRYSYSNRSYGVGSSIGLAGDVLNVQNLQQYSFDEIGYASQVECTINATSDWQLYEWVISNTSGVPNDYLAVGSLPNSDFVAGEDVYYVDYGSLFFDNTFTWKPEGYPVLGFSSNTEIVAIAGLSKNSRNIFAIAAYGYGGGQQLVATKYSFLNNTQCEVKFVPHQFHLSVDTTQLIINVTKGDQLDSQAERDFDPSTATFGAGLGVLAQRAMRQVMTLAMINISVYTSVIGDVFASNAQNALNAKAKGTLPISSSSSNTTVALLGVAQALESMLDDMLSGFSSAQLLLPAAPSSINVPATALVGAVKIGESKYIYPLAALNFAILLLLIEEAAVFRGWKWLNKFNTLILREEQYNDVKSVIAASSMGGVGIANQITARNLQLGKRWNADPRDHDVGRLRVRLVEDDNRGPMVVLHTLGLETPAAATTLGGGGGGSSSGGLSSSGEEFASMPLVTLDRATRRKPVARLSLNHRDTGWNEPWYGGD